MGKSSKGRAVAGCLGCAGSLSILLCAGLVLIGILGRPDNNADAPRIEPQPKTPARPHDRIVEEQAVNGAEPPASDESPSASPDFADTADNAADESALPPAKATVVFKSGKRQVLRDYEEDGDSYLLYGLLGGRGRYPKSLIDRFEPTTDADLAMVNKRIERNIEQADEIRRRKQREERKESAAKERSRPSEYNAVIGSGDGEPVFVAATEDSFGRLVEACNAGDTTGVQAMVVVGDAYVVEHGARALVLSHGFSKHPGLNNFPKWQFLWQTEAGRGAFREGRAWR